PPALGDGIRLQLEAAEQVARRLERIAGSLRQRSRTARVSRRARRSTDPLPRPRRAQCEQVDERLLHEPREGQAVVRRVRTAVRANVAPAGAPALLVTRAR